MGSYSHTQDGDKTSTPASREEVMLPWRELRGKAGSQNAAPFNLSSTLEASAPTASGGHRTVDCTRPGTGRIVRPGATKTRE